MIEEQLEGKVVLVGEKYTSDPKREFLCESGFGTSPNTSGSKIYGKWLSDNSDDVIRREFIEKVL